VPDFEKKEVHLLDPGVLLLALPEARRRQYLEKVAQGPKAAQDILAYLHKEGQLPQEAILRTLPTSAAFLRTIQEATQEALLEWRPLPRSPLGAYLPGSSVKGALRTAWLFWTLVEKDLVAEFSKGAWRLRPRAAQEEARIYPPRAPKLEQNQAFEAVALGYLGNKGPDLYQDPFRAVRLTDSAPQETFLNRIGVFHPKKDTSGLALLAETFRKGSRFTLGFRYHGGLSRHRGVSMPIPPKDLQRALREYYTKVAEWERGFAEEHRLKNALGVYEELFQRLKDPEVFPIRVGFGSGRLSLRLALLLPEDHPEAQEPKTRKTVGSAKPRDGFPLGWMVGRFHA
jgi:CRISPR-associated protein Csm5